MLRVVRFYTAQLKLPAEDRKSYHSLLAGMHIAGLLWVIHPVSALGAAWTTRNELAVSKHASKLPAHICQHVQRLLTQEMFASKHPCPLPPILQAPL